MIKLSHLKRNLPIIFLCLLSYGASLATDQVAHADGWEAGVAKTNITPKESLWLAGYGSRDRPSDGVISDLWIKALALEDKEGRQSVLVTMDLEEIPKSISERIKAGLSNLYGFSRAQVVLNVSHTHSSPVLEDFGDIYPLDSVQRERIKTYTDDFVKKCDEFKTAGEIVFRKRYCAFSGEQAE
ncbi:MAG: neutral/alkaline non-lysosomal ceramidase N-terminal domain-containing protein [Chitinophagaceae bacterium]|nr:neutral/alkaline non-lysosomal ceramidase N-terminal domain-containing protein [Chitinophagaceae bacterium]